MWTYLGIFLSDLCVDYVGYRATDAYQARKISAILWSMAFALVVNVNIIGFQMLHGNAMLPSMLGAGCGTALALRHKKH